MLLLFWSSWSRAQTSEPAVEPQPKSPTEETPASTSVAKDTSPLQERIQALEEKINQLSEGLAAERARRTSPPGAAPPTPPAPVGTGPKPEMVAKPGEAWLEALRSVVVTSYVQSQYESHDDSQDQLRQGGVPLNQNRFLIRRGRLKLEREWEYGAVMIELDGNTTRGPAFVLHHAEASVQWRGDNVAPAAPLVRLTLGLFDTPFGDELVESPRTRFFTERSLASRDFFPSEPDLGVRLAGEIGWFRYAFAVVNGEPNAVANGFPLQDPNQAKDLVAKIGANVTTDAFELAGDVSVLEGTGFVKGSDATKNAVVWNDTMPADGNLRPSELTGNPALAATPSRNFRRWAVGADAKIRLRWVLGWTQVHGELQLASNLDRGQFVANPTLTSDVRELGFYAGFVQEVTPFFVLGFRADYYDPNADVTDTQQGKLVPTNQRVVTFSPLVGAQLPRRTRLVFQYDFIRDHLARNALGVPTDLKNDAWTLRLQGEL
jgi:hypothetical protein